VAGLVLAAAGLALMTLTGAESSWATLLPGELVVCLGTGILNPALAAVAMSSLPERQSGLASGINDAFRQGGVAVGIAAFGALIPASAALGHGSGQAYVDALHHALLVGTAVAAIGAAACARLLARSGDERAPAATPTAPVAHELG
jgi:hypothetical protein